MSGVEIGLRSEKQWTLDFFCWNLTFLVGTWKWEMVDAS